MRNRTGLKLVAMAILMALLLVPFGVAEEVTEESELILDFEEEAVPELGEIDLMSQEIYGSEMAEEAQQGDEFIVGAPTDINDVVLADDGEQAVLAATGTCKHENLFLENGNETRISCKKAGKYQHVSIYRMTGTVSLECEDCGAVLYRNTVSSPVYMQERQLCSFNFITKNKKCKECKQKKTTCKHKRYHEVSKLYGMNDLNAWRDSSYLNEKNHITRVWVPYKDEYMRTQLYICDTCGAFATKTTIDGDVDFNWWTGFGWDEIGLSAECEERYEVQAHNYVNGICTGCGHIKVPGSVTLAATETRLPVKGKFDLSPTVSPAGSVTDIKYSTSNKKIATVNASGRITAKKAGTATITASVMGIPMASCSVTVYKAPKKVTLNKKKATLRVNDGLQLKAKISKGTWATFTWSSSNPAVASVDANGLVAAVGAGKAKITVKTSNGKKATCTVTVKSGTSKIIELSGYNKKDIHAAGKAIGGLKYYKGDGEDEIYNVYENNTVRLEGDETVACITLKRKANYALLGVQVGMSKAEAKSKMKNYKIMGDNDDTYGLAYIIKGKYDSSHWPEVMMSIEFDGTEYVKRIDYGLWS